MADKTVGELPRASTVTTTDLFVMEQAGQAKSLTGQVLINDLATALDGHGGIKSITLNDDYTLTFVMADDTEVQTTSVRGATGAKGDKGTDGRAITSVAKISTSGLVDTYKISFSDNTSTNFTVTNGSSIKSIAKTATSGLTDTYTVTLTDGTTSTFNVKNGNGIASITLQSGTHAAGTTDTYKITFDNGEFTTFSVYNGMNGSGSVVSVNTKSPDASGNVTLTGDDIHVSASDATTIPEAIAGAVSATDSGNGDIVVAGAAVQTAKRFLQSIIFPGLDFKFVNPMHNGTHADPYGIKVGSGASLVDAINALTEPGIYTIYQNRASTDVPAAAAAASSSLRGIACLSQINKHYAFIFMVDQNSNFYIQYVKSDVGGGWKQMLPDGTGVITESKIAQGAVTAQKIAPGAVQTANIGDGVVTRAKMAANVLGIASAGLTTTPFDAECNGKLYVVTPGTNLSFTLTSEVLAALPTGWAVTLVRGSVAGAYTYELNWEADIPVLNGNDRKMSWSGAGSVSLNRAGDMVTITKWASETRIIVMGNTHVRNTYDGTTEPSADIGVNGDVYLRYAN